MNVGGGQGNQRPKRKRPAARPRPVHPPSPEGGGAAGGSYAPKPPAKPKASPRPAAVTRPASTGATPRRVAPPNAEGGGAAGASYTPKRQAQQAHQRRAATRQAARERAGAPHLAPLPSVKPPVFTPRTPAPAFRPIERQAKPFAVEESRQQKRTRAALRALPEHPAIPNIPLKTGLPPALRQYSPQQERTALVDFIGGKPLPQGYYSDKEIKAIRTAYKAGAKKVGGKTINDLYKFGNLSQRRHMRRVGAAILRIEDAKNAQRVAHGGRPVGVDTVKAGTPPAGVLEEGPGGAIQRGFKDAWEAAKQHTSVPGTRGNLASLASIPVELGYATVENPGAVAKSSLRTGVESITGIPQGIKQMIADPKSALSAMAKDYERRYGPIFNDPAEFRRRVQNESGLTPFVMDAATVGVPEGRALTLLARSGAAGRAAAALARVTEGGRLHWLGEAAKTVHKTARAGRDAKILAGLQDRLHLATLEGDTETQAALRAEIHHAKANYEATRRPGLRFGAGEGGVRAQETSPNLFAALAQKGLDRTRARAYIKDANRHGWQVNAHGELTPIDGVEQSTFGALRPGTNEVLPKTSGLFGRSLRELPALRNFTGRVARDIGGQQSVTRIKLLTHRARILNRIDKTTRKLSPEESSAMKYMLQLGVTPDQAGVRMLEGRLQQIRDYRAGHTVKIAKVLEHVSDEVPVLERILADPAKYLTPYGRTVADELKSIGREESALDPELTANQRLLREVTPQGEALGVTRGPDAGYFRGVLAGIEHKTGELGLAQRADELATAMPGAERKSVARGLMRQARKARKRAERAVNTAQRRVAVLQARMDQAERRGVPFTTEEMRQAQADLAEAKRDRRRTSRELQSARRALARSSGRLGERERIGGPLVTEDVRAARKAVSDAQKAVNALERRTPGIEHAAGRTLGFAEGKRIPPGRVNAQLRDLRERLSKSTSDRVRETLQRRIDDLERYRGEQRGPNTRAADREATRAAHASELTAARERLRRAQLELSAVERAAPRLTRDQIETFWKQLHAPEDLQGDLAGAEARVAAAKGRLTDAIKNAPRTTETQAINLHAAQLEHAATKNTLENARAAEKAMRQVKRAAESKAHARYEPPQDFAERVRQAAEDAGLEDPAYWQSTDIPKDQPSLAAAGRGLRAAHRNKSYKGKLFRAGRERTDLEVFGQGVERNIKRRFQQALVARNLDTHAFEWSRGAAGEGATISELEREMLRRGIDPKTVEFVDPRVVRDRGAERAGLERGDVVDSALPEDANTSSLDLAEGRRTWEEVTRGDMRHQAQMRYFAIPKEVGQAVDNVASRLDSTAWRAWENLIKNKPARILLGAANIPWLAFQVASNGLLTGLGGGVNPFNVYGAYKWFKGLDHAEREAVEAELGITHGHHFGLDEPNLGATNNHLVNFWRAYKKSRVGRIGHRINPLNVMFRVDEKQNNFWRRVLFYDRARKQAYRRMGAAWKGIDQTTTRLMDRVLARPPAQQAALLATHGAEFEKVAKHVNDFLGDYLRFTPAERHLLSRNVMFYGYLRFSLRFALYTMPIAHPIMANILGNIGRMGAQEIKQLMGVSRGYQLPTSILSQTYFGDRKDAEKGKLRSLPFGRFNPFLNSITQLDGAQQVFGLVSPIYQALADQAFHESTYTGQIWRIGGRPTPSDSDRPRNYFGSMWSLLNPTAYSVPGVSTGHPRNRILESDLANLFYPYRVATKTGVPGIVKPLAPNQSNDALLWQPEPMMYADPTAMHGVNRSRKQAAQKSFLQNLGGQLVPAFPQPTQAPAVVAREQERQAAIEARDKRKPGQRKKRRSRKRSKVNYGGGSSSGGGRYG